MSPQTALAVFGVVISAFGIPGACILVFRSIRNPLRQQLGSMEKDRDYWRNKADELEAELRQRRQR